VNETRCKKQVMAQSNDNFLASGEIEVARIQEVLSRTRAEIERSMKLVKQIRAARNGKRKKQDPEKS